VYHAALQARIAAAGHSDKRWLAQEEQKIVNHEGHEGMHEEEKRLLNLFCFVNPSRPSCSPLCSG
jgi:hypothetical protein